MKGELMPYIVKKQMSRPFIHTEAEKPMSDFNVNPHVDDIFTVNSTLFLSVENFVNKFFITVRLSFTTRTKDR